jgi:hypothetical protein
MRLRSFSTVVIRIIGMMSIIYGLITLLFMLLTYSMLSGFGAGGGFPPGMGTMIWLQLLLPILMSVLGLILLLGGRSIGNLICSGLDD